MKYSDKNKIFFINMPSFQLFFYFNFVFMLNFNLFDQPFH